MMSPEMQTMMGNLSSILEEIQNMYGNEGMGMEAPAQMSAKEDMAGDGDMMEEKVESGYDEDMMKAQKALETTEPDATSASDDAEERMDETNTEITEDSVMEVAKALALLSGKVKAPVKKSAQKADPMVDAIHSLTRVVKGIADKQNATDTAVNGILEGLGVSSQLEKIQKSEDAKPLPVTNPDAGEMLKVFKSMLGQGAQGVQEVNEGPVTSNVQSNEVRKNLRSPEMVQFFRKGREGKF